MALAPTRLRLAVTEEDVLQLTMAERAQCSTHTARQLELTQHERCPFLHGKQPCHVPAINLTLAAPLEH